MNVHWEPMVYTPTVTRMDKCVLAYKKATESDSFWAKLAARIAVFVVGIFCIIGIVTISLLYKFIVKLNHKKDIDAFYESAKLVEPPNIPGHIEVDTKKQSFNHVSSFVIHNNIIWTKRRINDDGTRCENASWEPLYFDGVNPMEVKVDGANLIVLDKKNGVHYKKVIKEHYEKVDEFYESIPTDQQPSLKAEKNSCDHEDYKFTIDHGKVWYKKSADEKWKAIYVPLQYDFYGKAHLKAKELKINENGHLVVVNNRGGEHIITPENYDRKENYYLVHVKSDKDNWKKKWFTLPVVNPMINVFTGNRLYLSEKTKAWAIGHRGQFNHYIEDREKNRHPVATGVTTLYVLEEQGKYIYLFDPWKPQTVKVKIPVPGTTEKPFIAENLSVAASTILITGYEYETQKDGTILKKPASYTMIADVDSLGWNPALNYSYFQEDHEKNSRMRILPTAPKGWEKVLLPEGEITSKFTIIQTGEGNDSRQIRIIGKNEGNKGYWFKNLTEKEWQFKEMEIPYQEDYQAMQEEAVEEKPTSIFFNWENESGNIKLDNFNRECVVSHLRAGKANLILHRRENIILKILLNGKKLYHFDLVLPEDQNINDLPSDLQPYFENSRKLSVKLAKHNPKVFVIVKKNLRLLFTVRP